MSHQCYGCDKRFNKAELRYECMCIGSKGVCKGCAPNVRNINIPRNHQLDMLHDTSAEYIAYMKKVKDTIGDFHSFQILRDGNVKFTGLVDGKSVECTMPPFPKKMCDCCPEDP